MAKNFGRFQYADKDSIIDGIDAHLGEIFKEMCKDPKMCLNTWNDTLWQDEDIHGDTAQKAIEDIYNGEYEVTPYYEFLTNLYDAYLENVAEDRFELNLLPVFLKNDSADLKFFIADIRNCLEKDGLKETDGLYADDYLSLNKAIQEYSQQHFYDSKSLSFFGAMLIDTYLENNDDFPLKIMDTDMASYVIKSILGEEIKTETMLLVYKVLDAHPELEEKYKDKIKELLSEFYAHFSDRNGIFGFMGHFKPEPYSIKAEDVTREDSTTTIRFTDYLDKDEFIALTGRRNGEGEVYLTEGKGIAINDGRYSLDFKDKDGNSFNLLKNYADTPDFPHLSRAIYYLKNNTKESLKELAKDKPHSRTDKGIGIE